MMISTGSRHLCMTACCRILPSQGSRGMSSRCSPRGVISSQLSSASVVLRFSTALRVMRKGGGPGLAPAPLQLLVLRQHAGRLLLSLHPSTVQRSPAAADTRADPHTIILREYLCMVASISLFHFSSWWLMLSTCCVFISRTRVGCTKNNLANSAAIKSHVSPVSRRL